MPQIISCPDCSRKLRVPDNLLGKKVKCPDCDVKFVAKADEEPDEESPPPPAPVTTRPKAAPRSSRPRDEGVVEKPTKSRRRDNEEVDDEDDDIPAKRKRREADEDDNEDYEPQQRKPKKREIYKGWQRVRLGINLVAVSMWTLIGGVVAVFLLSCLISALIGASAGQMDGGAPNEPFGQRPPAGAVAGASVGIIVIAALMILLSLAYMGTQMTGFGFCMGVVSTPKTQALKILAVATFSLSIGILLVRMVSYGATMVLAQNGYVVAGALTWVITPLFLAEATCFLFFLRGVAVVMRRDDLARAIVVYMITIGVIIGLSVIAVLILMFAGMAAAFVAPSPGAMPGVGRNLGGFVIVTCGLMLLMFGVSLWLLIRFMLLLYQVRSAVDRWLDRN